MKSKVIKIYAAAFMTFMVWSCTDLNETLYSEVLKDNFYQTESEIVAAVAPAYGDLRGISGNVWDLQNHTTDETIIPTRGTNWYDGGHWQRNHEHTWTSETPQINSVWGFAFGRINKANQLLFQLSGLTNIDPKLKAQFETELKIIRSFGYYYAIDFFGNVPIVDRFDVPIGYMPSNDPSFADGRKNAFDFAVKDIVDNIANLSENVNTSTYGRFHKWAAYALLAKFYINAEVWTGQAKWDEVIAACDAIINSGKFRLETDYFANFATKNEGSRENIFVIPYDENKTEWGLTWYFMGHHPATQSKYNTTWTPWGGFCALPSHYKSFNPSDKRRLGWITGLQYSSSGELIKCVWESAPSPLDYTVDFGNIYNANDPAIYDHRNAREYNGARFVKYAIGALPGWGMGNDVAVFRYADILLLKAEALMRKNGGTATPEAVNLVNQVRARSIPQNPYTVGTLTLDQLLQERSWELYYEGMRRNDLIRFGKFVRGNWEFFDRSGEGDYRNVFPIPQPQINANKNLKQNPGY